MRKWEKGIGPSTNSGEAKSECRDEKGELRMLYLGRIKKNGERPEGFRLTAFGTRHLITGTVINSDSGYQ